MVLCALLLGLATDPQPVAGDAAAADRDPPAPLVSAETDAEETPEPPSLDLTWVPPARASGPTQLRWVPLPPHAAVPAPVDLGVLDPRQAGCLTQTPGLPPSPACRLALESRFGPQAVQPATPAAGE